MARPLVAKTPGVPSSAGPPAHAPRIAPATFDVRLSCITDRRRRAGLDRLIELAKNVHFVVVDRHMARNERLQAAES